jgi:ribonuclease-3
MSKQSTQHDDSVSVSASVSLTSSSISGGYINPFNKNNKVITKNVVQNILKKYGIYQNINNLSLYQEAMIHESYSLPKVNEVCARDNVKVVRNPDGCVQLQHKSYERLELLGDAVIENIIVYYLFRRFPNEPEGFLSQLKVNFVNRITLGHLAKIIGLNEYLVVSKTLDDKLNARQEDKILCDIFEAFMGALFVDFNSDKHGFLQSFISGAGYQVAEQFMINLIEDEMTGIDITKFILNDTNYKDKIIKYMRRIYNAQVKFVTTKNDIDDIHMQIVNVKTNENLGEGSGKNVKYAEQNTSKNALIKLGLLQG